MKRRQFIRQLSKEGCARRISGSLPFKCDYLHGREKLSEYFFYPEASINSVMPRQCKTHRKKEREDKTMDFWTFLLLFVTLIFVPGIVWGTIISITKRRRISRMEEKLNGLENFNATQKVMDIDGKTGLAIDEKKKKYV